MMKLAVENDKIDYFIDEIKIFFVFKNDEIDLLFDEIGIKFDWFKTWKKNEIDLFIDEIEASSSLKNYGIFIFIFFSQIRQLKMMK